MDTKNSKVFDIAIIGATGMVGGAVRELLQQRQFPINTLYLLASERTAGARLSFNDKSIMVKLLHEFDFSQVQIAIFAATDQVSADYIPKAVEAGCLVLDNSQYSVDDEEIPLVIPGVNTDALDAIDLNDPHKRIVANPDSVVIQLWAVLKPIYDITQIVSVTVATYQAVSGQGKSAISELAKQTISILNGQGAKASSHNQQLAFNVLPVIGKLVVKGPMKGHSSAELQLVQQSRRIIADSQLRLSATCVQVPVFHADSIVVHIEAHDPISAEKVIGLLKKNNQINVLGGLESNDYVTPVKVSTKSAAKSSKNEDKVFVSRIRNDLNHDRGLNLWIVGDDVRKGAALNTVRIAENLIKSHL